MKNNELSKLKYPALVITDEARGQMHVIRNIDLTTSLDPQIADMVGTYTGVEIKSQLDVDATARALKEANIFVYIMDLKDGQVHGQVLHDGKCGRTPITDLSFLEPVVTCDMFWDCSHKSAVKAIIKAVGGTGTVKHVKQRLVDKGQPSKYRDALKVVLKLGERIVRKKMDSEGDKDFIANVLGEENIEILSSKSKNALAGVTGDEARQALEQGEVPEDVLDKLPKKVRKALKRGDAKVIAVDTSTLPLEVLEELRQLTKGRQLHELDDDTAEKVMVILEKQPNVFKG